RRLLGDAFELELEPGAWRLSFDSPEHMWEWWSTVVPPFVALLEGLAPEPRDAVREQLVALAERRRTNGRVDLARDYVLCRRRRRGGGGPGGGSFGTGRCGGEGRAT